MFDKDKYHSEMNRYRVFLDIEKGLSRNTLSSYTVEMDKFERFLEKRGLDYLKISEEDISYVMNSVREAADERIDMYRFTSEVSENLSYDIKVSIIEKLFSVACSDKDLNNNEYEVIRKISGLFGLAHNDFINAKIKIKKEFGLDTAGF